MKQLSILTLRFTDIKELPSTLGNLVGLSKLELAALESIVLPVSLGCFVGLKKLDLSGCNELSCVPYSSYGLESLTVWDSSDNSNIVGLLSSLSLLTSLSSLKLWVSFPTSKEYDLGHLASLTDLDLSCNSFSRVPISIHELPRLKCLDLNNCSFLEVLPELPSSLRELRAEDCYSLDASSVNDVISKACCVFAESATKDCEEILQIVIHGKEIPAWFEHQEQDNAVSVSFPHNGTSTETLALALCFLFEDETFSNEQPWMICNGKEFISKSLLKVSSCICSENLFIVCLNGYYFSNLLSQHNRFQMLFPNIGVQRCGARWVCKQDIQDFKK
ncbi:TMV resistance protein N [Arachis hypogaea]|nr:TMV resistance protein N [Arachis hypogaea]